jgi:NAD(P)-dependent dehydrogenase (short-subunit alcohol dehydrogenase family)
MSNKKIAFITGGNRGIGFETAKQLGSQDIIVVIGSRDPENGQKAADDLIKLGVEANFIQFDVTDKASHDYAYEYFESNFGRLDILINNAGVVFEGEPSEVVKNKKPVTSVTEKILRDTLDANFISTVLLTERLLPLIENGEAGRIVNVASFLGSLTLQSDPSSPVYPVKSFAYNTSKVAINSFTVHLAYELKDTPIKVNSADPGWVQTRMGGSSAMVTVEEGAKTSVRLATLPADGPTGTFSHLDQAMPW